MIGRAKRSPSVYGLVSLVVWGGFVLAPPFLGSWQVGQLAQFFTYGLFAMVKTMI